MAIRKARAVWEGNLEKGQGTMVLGTGGLEVPYSFGSRVEDGSGSNPEELIGAAHAGCFSMALAHGLGEAGHVPVRVATTAKVHLEKSAAGFAIPKVELETEADVPGVDDETFQRVAQAAKQGCPVSKVLSAADITLNAKLLSSQATSPPA
jgi:osmotically inducible protein OsmC